MNTYQCTLCKKETIANSDAPYLMSKCCDGAKPVRREVVGKVHPTAKHQMVVPLQEIQRKAAESTMPSMDVSGGPVIIEQNSEGETKIIHVKEADDKDADGMNRYNTQPKKAE